MARGEVIIAEKACLGCGYCVAFCPKRCIEISEDKIGPRGFMLPFLVDSEECNACGICGWFCPHSAIEVYRFVENEAAPAAQ